MRKRVEENGFNPAGFDLGGTISGAVEVGAKVNIMPGIDPNTLKFDVKVYGGTAVGGDIRVRTLSDKNQVILVFYADPLKIGYKAEITVAGFRLIDMRGEENYGDRVQLRKEYDF